MKKILSLATVASIAICAVPAQAHHNGTFGSTAGTYTFSGPVDVIKNLGTPTSCTLTAVVVVDALGHATTSSSLSGPFPCSFLTFSPASVDTVGFQSGGVDYLALMNFTTNIPPVPPYTADSCTGTLTAIFNQGATPSIEFQYGLSDTPYDNAVYPNDCQIAGTVTQVSGPGALNWVP